MIDKEKLLKEIRSLGYYEETQVIKTIKNFPEEPEIDFYALYEEWNNSPTDDLCFAHSFRNFLKSKNLTVPKPVEIPVKRTWTLKKEYHEYHLKMCIGTMVDVKVDEEPQYPEYYYLHEEPDYSKIPKGSIAEFKCGVNGGKTYYKKITGYENNTFLTTDGDWSKESFVRVVELAKE